MTRPYCRQPDSCVAGKRGPCGLCSDTTANAERMRRLNADPEFAVANAERGRERMRRLHQDPEFAAAHAERMRRRHQDPEFRRRLRSGRAGIAIPKWVPDDLIPDFVDVALLSGEEAAAAHVRRLKREAAHA